MTGFRVFLLLAVSCWTFSSEQLAYATEQVEKLSSCNSEDVNSNECSTNKDDSLGVTSSMGEVSASGEIVIDDMGEKHKEDDLATKGKDASKASTEKDIKHDNDSIKSVGEFIKAFSHLGTSWNHVLDSYIDVVRSAEGKSHNGDIYADDIESALEKLRSMVAEEEDEKWSFGASPLDEFSKTTDDVLFSFLRWSSVDGVKDEDNQELCNHRGGINKQYPRDEAVRINVSKAFRRLDAYATWMYATGDTMHNLTAASIKGAWDAFHMQITYDDCERLVWWLDLAQADLEAIRHFDPDKTLRMFVWFAHFLMFEERAQQNGIVFIDNMAKLGFWKYMTMLPVHLGMKIDKFVISVIPLKSKLVVFMERPLWMDVGYGILSVFLTRKMKQRVVMVGRKPQSVVEELVGKECIPMGFGILNGTMEVDVIADKK